MANLDLISKQTHLNKYWRRPVNFQFTRNDSFCPITLMEVPAAAMSLPICFLADENRFQLGLLLGLKPESNLAIDSQGKWVFDFIPGYYQAYPFALAKNSDGNLSLCFQSNSNLISNDPHDEAFFIGDGEPTEAVAKILNDLSSLSASNRKTDLICDLLRDLELLEPWPITIKDGNQTENVEGVYRVNEKALAKLNTEEFIKLRDNDALVLIYGQLFSTQNLHRLGKRLLTVDSNINMLPEELDLDGLIDQGNGNINFSNF